MISEIVEAYKDSTILVHHKLFKLKLILGSSKPQTDNGGGGMPTVKQLMVEMSS